MTLRRDDHGTPGRDDHGTLRRDDHGPVRVLTLDRPERRNALDPPLLRALGGALADAADDPAVRAVVLAAAGERAFCAGMDLRAFAELGPEAFAAPTGVERLLDEAYPKPVVAAVGAPALAGGFELVLACDVVVASDSASFALPETRRGLVAAGGALRRLPRRVPLNLALDMGLSGRAITAAEAHRAGLVQRVVADDEVRAAAVDVARGLAAGAPLAVRATKELLLASAGEHELDRAAAAELIERVFASADAREGATAFAERRDPRWTGR